jgi:endonuclease YncB( thermonuclease family)
MAVLGCVALLSAGVWLLGRPSEAPANAPETGILAATAPSVAVVDGGTLRLGDRVVRLDGLIAPERGEMCPSVGSGETDCGAAAANALASLVRDTRVECNWAGRDPVGRPLAVCSARGVDINQALVSAGWARAGAGHPAMLAAEQQAKAARRGLWARG